jgi:hypothetical protein
VPNLPTGTSTVLLALPLCCTQKPTARELFIASRQHLRLLDQRWRYAINRDLELQSARSSVPTLWLKTTYPLLRIRRGKPMDQPVQRTFRARIMRPNNTSRDSSHARDKDDASPALALQSRHTKLCQKVRRPAIDAPGILEGRDGYLIHRLDARLDSSTMVVDEDIGRAQQRNDVLMELSDLQAHQPPLPLSTKQSRTHSYLFVVSQIRSIADKLAPKRVHVLLLELL